MRPWHSRIILTVLMVLCVVVRLAFASWGDNQSYQAQFNWDGWGRIAQHVANGEGMVDDRALTYFPLHDGARPTAARSPLPVLVFAGVLRLFGKQLMPLMLVQIGFDVVTLLLVYAVCRRLARARFFPAADGEQWAELSALLAASAFVLFFPEWRAVSGFQSEPLYTMLLTAAIGFTLFVSTARQSAAAGALYGLAALCRPAILPFPFLLLPWLVWHRRLSVKTALLMPLAMLVVMTPWVVRNYSVFERPILTQTLGGYDLYRHSGVIAEDNYLRWVEGEEGNAKILALLKSRGLSVDAANEAQIDELLKSEAHRIIRAHPVRFVQLCLYRAATLFYFDTTVGPRSQLLFFLFIAAPLTVIGTGWIFCRGQWRMALMPVWLLIVCTVGVHAIMVAQYRYLLPLIPSLLIVAACVVGYTVWQSAPFRWRTMFVSDGSASHRQSGPAFAGSE